MSEIIVCHEKHDTVYWDASTPEALADSALAILTWRWNDGYWYHEPTDDGLGDSEWAEEEREARRKALAITKDVFDTLPKEAQQEVLRLRNAARQDTDEDRRERDWYARAKRVVEEQDKGTITVGRNRFEREVPEAWRLLEERSDYEYERVEHVELWTRERYDERNAKMAERNAS